MQDAAAVGEGQRAGEQGAQPGGLARVQRAVAPEPALERLARNEVHDQVGRPALLADAVDADDVRVLEARGGARLDGEALQLLRVRAGAEGDLDRDLAAEPPVEGAVDDAHAAARELALELEVSQPARRRCGLGGDAAG
ncbi:MAG: hypothetical protein M9894_02960 [Planctomycetes bacterium]|nr:hypothetical protein [Planctomycetota bacterium]